MRTAEHKHDWKLVGFNQRLRTFPGMRAHKLCACARRGCSASTVRGGFHPDPYWTPSATGSPADVLAWIGARLPADEEPVVEDLPPSPLTEWVEEEYRPISGAAARTLFAVGTGNISSTGIWSLSSGGTTGQAIPTASDDVILDTHSGNVTIDSTLNCRSLDCNSPSGSGAYAGTLTHNTGQFIAPAPSVAGTTVILRFSSAMTYTLVGSPNISTTLGTTNTTMTVTTAGKTMPSISFNATPTSGFQLTDAMTTTTTATVTHTQGVLNTNGQTCSWGLFVSNNASTRTITLGSSSITITGSTGGWNMATTTGLTWTANTATITLNGATQTINIASLTATGTSWIISCSGVATITGASPSMVNITRTGTAVKTDSLVLSITGTLTVTGTLTLNANSTVNRLLVQGVTLGTQVTISAATLVCLNVIDFQDIKGAGAATWTTAASGATSFGDCQGNSGVTFTTAVTQTWSGNTTGSWSTAANWTSRVPLPQDNVTISGLTSGVITADMPRLGASVNFTGSTGGAVNPSFNLACFGSFISATGIQLNSSDNLTLSGRGAYTFLGNVTGGGGYCNMSIVVQAPGGTYTLTGSFATANGLTVTLGTFVSNGFSMSLQRGLGGAGTWNIANSTVTCFGGGATTAWIAPTTLVSTGSTIILTVTSSSTFQGGGLTYNNLQVNTGALITVTGANTFNTITEQPGAGIIWPAGVTNTVTSFVATGQNNGYLKLPGVAANYASTPDATALRFGTTNSMTIDCQVSLPSWAPASQEVFFSKLGTNTGYEFAITTGGALVVTWGSGSAFPSKNTGAAVVSGTAGQKLWVRLSFSLSGGTMTIKFYTSSDGTSWTQLGTTQTQAATSLTDDSTIPAISTRAGGAQFPTPGSFYEVRVYNSALGSGSGTPVFDANFATKPFGANTFTESSSNAATVTINGTLGVLGDGRCMNMSSTGGTQATLRNTSGVDANDFMYLQDMAATGGATWYAGGHSNNVSDNTGWTFTTLTPITLGGSASSSGTSASITAPTQIPLGTSSSASSTAAQVTAPSLASLGTAASQSSTSLQLTAPTEVTGLSASSTSSTSASLTAATVVPLGGSASASSAAMDLIAAMNLSTASNSTASLTLMTPILLSLDGSSSQSSTADLVVRTPIVVPCDSSDSTSGDSLVISVPVRLVLQGSSSSSTTNLYRLPVPGPPGTITGTDPGHITWYTPSGSTELTDPGHVAAFSSPGTIQPTSAGHVK